MISPILLRSSTQLIRSTYSHVLDCVIGFPCQGEISRGINYMYPGLHSRTQLDIQCPKPLSLTCWTGRALCRWTMSRFLLTLCDRSMFWIYRFDPVVCDIWKHTGVVRVIMAFARYTNNLQTVALLYWPVVSAPSLRLLFSCWS